jgi:hypothetical protein
MPIAGSTDGFDLIAIGPELASESSDHGVDDIARCVGLATPDLGD